MIAVISSSILYGVICHTFRERLSLAIEVLSAANSRHALHFLPFTFASLRIRLVSIPPAKTSKVNINGNKALDKRAFRKQSKPQKKVQRINDIRRLTYDLVPIVTGIEIRFTKAWKDNTGISNQSLAVMRRVSN